MIANARAYARIGFMGNPSDGFYGKTLSGCMYNFYAEVFLKEHPVLEFVSHPTHDPVKFANLGELTIIADRFGYYGGLRLIYATCKHFTDYCKEHGIKLADRNFILQYDTNIPRQVGLGGSSAIIVAVWKALMGFYELTTKHIPLEIQPNLVRSVETEELLIEAGLQDRVIQIYGGLVYMDFQKSLMHTSGHGKYIPMNPNLLPNFFLAYTEHPGKTSGTVHNEMRFRFNKGERKVLEAMEMFAFYAAEAKEALEIHNIHQFGGLMILNFALREQIYGDLAIGLSREMIDIARDLGAPVKFPGSGGAVVGIYDSADQFERLKEAYRAAGYKFIKVLTSLIG